MAEQPSRRRHDRFDIVGALWGLLEVGERVRIRNISATGALLESPQKNAVGSTIAMRVMADGRAVTLEGYVRQVRPVDSGQNPGRFLLGVEFLSPPESVIRAIQGDGAAPLGTPGEPT